MASASLVFPHQLFMHHPALKNNRLVFLLEDPLFFEDQEFPVNFHVQKRVYHRATMKHYQESLEEQQQEVQYIEWNELRKTDGLLTILQQQKIQELHVVDPTDDVLRQRLRALSKKLGAEICWYENPNFVSPLSALKQYFQHGKDFMAEFYKWQRKRLNVMLTKEGGPEGGKWSYDAENRKKLPKDLEVPALPEVSETGPLREAREYVKKTFPKSPGSSEVMNYPVTRRSALSCLQSFFEQRFEYYGPYQDALEPDNSFLFHSLLTPALNVGLISAEEVVQKALEYREQHEVPIASFEGFLRQIIGWREFIRAMYERKGRVMRTKNFWGHSRKIPKSFWTGETGIIPVDMTIKRVLKTAYANHIERLMVLGNFMLLCEFDPDEVYQWFSELFIDAYDWVMVPNVYGMSQFADGGIFATKPYISGSNYLRKMSHYPKGDWQEIWDALYWRFIMKHEGFFASNPRMSMMTLHLKKMDSDKKKHHLETAEQFLKNL